MADDQATLGRFAEKGAEQADDGPGDASRTDDGPADREQPDPPTEPVEREPVCPWCLAPAAVFEDGGPTGTSCGRCSAALPVDTDWFLAGDVVARRPMHDDRE